MGQREVIALKPALRTATAKVPKAVAWANPVKVERMASVRSSALLAPRRVFGTTRWIRTNATVATNCSAHRLPEAGRFVCLGVARILNVPAAVSAIGVRGYASIPRQNPRAILLAALAPKTIASLPRTKTIAKACAWVSRAEATCVRPGVHTAAIRTRRRIAAAGPWVCVCSEFPVPTEIPS